MATNTTLADRIVSRRMPPPTLRQFAAATEILARAEGKDERLPITDDQRNGAIAPFVEQGTVTLLERLDAAKLTEQHLFERIKQGTDANKDDSADHPIRLKATRTALELRGLLSSRGGVHVQSAGNCQVNVGLSWSPPPSVAPSDAPSTELHTVTQSLTPTGPGTSTSEGTGIGRGGRGHSRSTAKTGGNRSSGAVVGIPISEMSISQLTRYCTVEQRRAELLRRQKVRAKKNPRVRKHVGRNHRGKKGGDSCKSGKCGRCNKCRLERRRVATNPDGSGVYAK